MEKIITYGKNISNYNYFDGILLQTFLSEYQDENLLDFNEVKFIIDFFHRMNKKVYFRADRILLETEIADLMKYIEIIKNADGIFFEDFAYLQLFKNEKNFKKIYFPFESIVSISDANTLLEFGVDGIIFPRGFDNIMKKDVYYQNFGYIKVYKKILFTSRRKLLSLKDLNRKSYYIKESTRNSWQKIIEFNYGTVIIDDNEQIINNDYLCDYCVYDYMYKEVDCDD